MQGCGRRSTKNRLLTAGYLSAHARTGYVCSGPDKGKYTDLETGAIITNPRARLNEHALDAQTGEAGVKGDQEEKESRRAAQSQNDI